MFVEFEQILTVGLRADVIREIRFLERINHEKLQLGINSQIRYKFNSYSWCKKLQTILLVPLWLIGTD